MSKSTISAPDCKGNRTVRLVRAPHPTGPGKLVIVEKKGRTTTTTSYLLTYLDAKDGAAFQVAKIGRTVNLDGSVTISAVEKYHVQLGTYPTCSCPWGIYGANKKPCRHVSALLLLGQLGKLNAPVPA